MVGVKESGHCTRRGGQRWRGHCFGAHLSIAGGMHHAIEAALRLGFDTVQVFVKNQRQWGAASLVRDDVDRWHELLQTPGFGPPVAHATYLINLASAEDALWRRSRTALAAELQRCHVLAIPYLVVHPGAAGQQPRERAIARVAAALNRLFDEQPHLTTMVLLETTAGQGTTLGRTFAELAAIVGQVQEPQRVGVCIDTCHVFAAGYDIREPHLYEQMIQLAARQVDLRRVRCWHINDSQGELGSHLDRHEHVGLGCIGDAGFRNVLADRRFVGLPIILETAKGRNSDGEEWDAVNLRRLQVLARRARWTDLQADTPRRDRTLGPSVTARAAPERTRHSSSCCRRRRSPRRPRPPPAG